MTDKLYFKTALFNLSLLPLYFIFIIQYIDISPLLNFDDFETLSLFSLALLNSNIKILFFIFLILLGLFGLLLFKKNNKYNRENAKEFQYIESKDFDHMTFLSTYVLPLITFNLNDAHSFVVLIFLLLMIGAIYIKSNLYYLNPTLLLFGYKIYKAKESNKNVVLISKSSIETDCTKARYIDLGKNIYFLKDTHGCN